MVVILRFHCTCFSLFTFSVQYTVRVTLLLSRLSLFIGSYEGQVYAVDSLVRDTDLKLEVRIPHLL